MIYEFRCDTHGVFEKPMSCAEYEAQGAVMCECGQPAQRVLSLFSFSMGLAREVDAKAEATGTRAVSADSLEWRDRKLAAQEDAEEQAREEGFRDREHKRAVMRNPRQRREFNAETRKAIAIKEGYADHQVDPSKGFDSPLPEGNIQVSLAS